MRQQFGWQFSLSRANLLKMQGEEMKIRDLLESLETRDIHCSAAEVSVLAASQLLHQFGIGAVPIVDEDEAIVGILSERDIVRTVAERADSLLETKIEDVMTKDVLVCEMNDSVEHVHGILLKNNIRHIPVVENGRLIEMISIKDFKVGSA